MGKKFYAVAAGREPGVYSQWPEAERQVKGFPGAKFKGFASRAEAEAWLEAPCMRRGRREHRDLWLPRQRTLLPLPIR